VSFGGASRGCTGRRGIGIPSSSKAWRWVGVASVSCSKVTSVPATLFVLRVSVAGWSSRPWKGRIGVPSRSARRAALADAPGERLARAEGSARSGGALSVKVSGAHAVRKCQVRCAPSMQRKPCAHPVGQAVADRAELYVDDLHVTGAVALCVGKRLVGLHHLCGCHLLFTQRGGDHGDPVESDFGGDRVCVAQEAEVPSVIPKVKCLAILRRLTTRPAPRPILLGGRRRPASRWAFTLAKSASVASSSSARLACRLGGEKQVGAGHEALSIKVGMGDLDQVHLVEERRLDHPVFDQLRDLGGPQGADPVDAAVGSQRLGAPR